MNRNTKRLKKRGLCSVKGTEIIKGKTRACSIEQEIRHGKNAFTGRRAVGRKKWLSQKQSGE